MQRQSNYLDTLEGDEVYIRREMAEGLPKRPYSPRFASRKSKRSVLSNGARGRRAKRSCM